MHREGGHVPAEKPAEEGPTAAGGLSSRYKTKMPRSPLAGFTARGGLSCTDWQCRPTIDHCRVPATDCHTKSLPFANISLLGLFIAYMGV